MTGVIAFILGLAAGALAGVIGITIALEDRERENEDNEKDRV